MNIPLLERENRKREYDNYSPPQRRAVVEAYLFKGMSHRQIEKEVLHLDCDYFRGWQSMSILHYLGLRNSFKGFFRGMSVAQAVAELKANPNDDYTEIISILSESSQQ